MSSATHKILRFQCHDAAWLYIYVVCIIIAAQFCLCSQVLLWRMRIDLSLSQSVCFVFLLPSPIYPFHLNTSSATVITTIKHKTELRLKTDLKIVWKKQSETLLVLKHTTAPHKLHVHGVRTRVRLFSIDFDLYWYLAAPPLHSKVLPGVRTL